MAPHVKCMQQDFSIMYETWMHIPFTEPRIRVTETRFIVIQTTVWTEDVQHILILWADFCQKQKDVYLDQNNTSFFLLHRKKSNQPQLLKPRLQTCCLFSSLKVDRELCGTEVNEREINMSMNEDLFCFSASSSFFNVPMETHWNSKTKTSRGKWRQMENANELLNRQQSIKTEKCLDCRIVACKLAF